MIIVITIVIIIISIIISSTIVSIITSNTRLLTWARVGMRLWKGTWPSLLGGLGYVRRTSNIYGHGCHEDRVRTWAVSGSCEV